MSSHENYWIKLPNCLSFSVLDCVFDVGEVSKRFEKKAKVIWVITKDLSLDLKDEVVQKAVTNNFEKHKYYTYILPASVQSKEYEMKYNKIYKDYIGKYNFVYIPAETYDLFEELVIYDKKDGFVLLTLETNKSVYIKISSELVEEYVKKLLQYFNDFSEVKNIALELSTYPEIMNNDVLKEHFDKLYQMPVLLKTQKGYDEFVSFLKKVKMSEGLINNFKSKITALKFKNLDK